MRRSEFTDKTLNGKTVTLPFISEFIIWNGARHYKTEVWLTNSSKEVFNYQKTRQLQGEVSGDPFAQPVQAFSNMSNGFGIFGGLTPDIETVKAPAQP